MFEVGKSYEFRTYDWGEESSWHGTVEAYDHPLLKLADRHLSDDSPFFPSGSVPGRILNVSSPAFISATISKHQG
jgi:hypothetical protein